jgi:type I restriction enzyme M protein
MENKSKKQSKNKAKKYESNDHIPNTTPLTQLKKRKVMVEQTPSQIANILWNAKELLRNDYRLSQYRHVILPFVVLKRLDAVIQTKHDVMLKESKILGKGKEELLQNRIKDLTDLDFYNISEYNLSKLVKDPDHIHKNLKEYMRGFSKNILDIFKRFDFQIYVDKLKEQGLLYQTVKYFESVPLDINSVDNIKMGTIYEMLIETSSEASNEEAGDHFTPREVIRLMVNLLFEGEKDILSMKKLIKRIYDPACGTGGMLSIAEEYIQKKYPNVTPEVFGQEINDMTYAISESDMMLKEIDHDVKFGNSLNQNDGFSDKKFDYILSNPPYGVDWKKYEGDIKKEADRGTKGRYHAGLPRTSDGSLLFIMHMISKMNDSATGSRIAVVFNGSPLFTGEAGNSKNENSIRKWIITNNWLEAIVALPRNLFFNTGIQTYIWIITNRKDPKRGTKVQLIDAESFSEKMKKKVGDKSNKITDTQIEEITKIYKSFEEGEYCKKFDNDDFGYFHVTIERPKKRRFQITPEGKDRLQQQKAFKCLHEVKSKKEVSQEEILEIVNSLPTKAYKNFDSFKKIVTESFEAKKLKPKPSHYTMITNSFSERDDTADPQKDKNGNLVPDSDLRDFENIPLKQDIDEYFEKEVKPYVPDAWINEDTRNNIGYDIPFTKHFYKYKPLPSLEKIDAEIKKLQKDIVTGLDKLMEDT